MENEIQVMETINEEVVETTGGLLTSGKGKVVAGVGLVLVVAGAIYGGYRFIKSRKAKKQVEDEVIEVVE